MSNFRTIQLEQVLRSNIVGHDGLPSPPVDPRGRHVSWAICAEEGTYFYGGEEFTVDSEWIDVRVEAFHAVRSESWTQPILVEHKSEGLREGDVLEMRRVALDGKETLLAALAWADPNAAKLIAEGRLTHVSLGLYTVELYDSGDIVRHAPLEVSMTTMPHLAYARILNGGLPMSNRMLLAAASVADAVAAAKEALAGLEEAIAASPDLAAMDEARTLGEALVSATEGSPETTDEEPEESPATMSDVPAPPEEDEEVKDDPKVMSLQKEVEELRNQLRLEREGEFQTKYEVGGAIRITAEVKEILLSIYRADPKAFVEVERAYERPTQKAEKSDAQPVNEIRPWTMRMSTPDVPEPRLALHEINVEDVLVLARKKAKEENITEREAATILFAERDQLRRAH